MVTGIYLLKFEGTNKVYVGQSIDIYKRFTEHKLSFKLGLCSEKLKYAFSTFGTPSLLILTECSKEELDKEENEAIEIFNAVVDGFNTKGKSGSMYGSNFGELASQSKYSNIQYIAVFKLLVENILTFAKITEATGVSIATIRLIASLDTHRWLKDLYPDEYKILESIKGTRKESRSCAAGQGKTYPPIISPNGEVFTNISNISKFAAQHKLDHSATCKVLNGRITQHKGWKLV